MLRIQTIMNPFKGKRIDMKYGNFILIIMSYIKMFVFVIKHSYYQSKGVN